MSTQTETKPPAAPPSSKRYFRKAILTSAFIGAGKPVPFEALAGNQGVIALDPDDPLIAILDKAAAEQVGGIVRISEAEYAQKKTQYPLPPSGSKSQPGEPMLRVAGKAFRPPPPIPKVAGPADPTPGQSAPPAPPATSGLGPALPPIGPEAISPWDEQPPIAPPTPKEPFKPATKKLGAEVPTS